MHDMTTRAHGAAASLSPHEIGDPAKRARIEALLRAYPKTTETENSELLRFLTSGSQIDIGLIAGDDELAPKVEGIRKRFKSHFGMKLKDGAWFFGLTLGPAAVYLVAYLMR